MARLVARFASAFGSLAQSRYVGPGGPNLDLLDRTAIAVKPTSDRGAISFVSFSTIWTHCDALPAIALPDKLIGTVRDSLR
jgi:hypothetical protein